jgi:HSP20 family protein
MTDNPAKSAVTTETAKAKQELQPAASPRLPSRWEDLDHFFDQFLRRNWLRPWRLDWPSLPEFGLPELRAPKVDVIDRDGEVVVKAEIPGVDKKDLDISVGDDSVTIKGETRKEEKEEKGDYYRCEISRGSFSRTVALPAAVDGAKATATFQDGILQLTLPTVKAAQRHNIAIE